MGDGDLVADGGGGHLGSVGAIGVAEHAPVGFVWSRSGYLVCVEMCREG